MPRAVTHQQATSLVASLAARACKKARVKRASDTSEVMPYFIRYE